MLHSLKQRLRLQHHPFAAAERPVIHGTMPVLREHAQILHVHFNNSRLSRAPQNPVIQRPHKKIRKNGDQIKTHRRESITRNSTRANLPAAQPQSAARRHQSAYKYPQPAESAVPPAPFPLPAAGSHARSRPHRETAHPAPYPILAGPSPSNTAKKPPPASRRRLQIPHSQSNPPQKIAPHASSLAAQ